MKFPFYKQLNANDCGIECLRMVSKYYGKSIDLISTRKLNYLTKQGISLLSLKNAAISLGFNASGYKLRYNQLLDTFKEPCILFWNQNHFVVLYKIKKNKIYIADPAIGKVTYEKTEFSKKWANNEAKEGIVLTLTPNSDFEKSKLKTPNKEKAKYIYSHVKPYKKKFANLIVGMILACVIQFLIPYLTQSIVDVGIKNNDLNFIYLILVGQIVLLFSNMSVEFIRSRLLLNISKRVNISFLSVFLFKLISLPVSYFDRQNFGDINQKINDNNRIENFLTNQFITSIYTILILFIFSFVLYTYSIYIFIVFFVGSIIYLYWSYTFLEKRFSIDNIYFNASSERQNVINELIQGMVEIKVNQCQNQKIIAWEKVQANLFKLDFKRLLLSQYHISVATIINETKNILITVYTAYSVINGHISLGMMLAIQYMLGQLSRPLAQLVEFIYSAQDAKISFDRMYEIHLCDNEDLEKSSIKPINELENKIIIENLSFQYEGPQSPKVLENINCTIPKNKVTAIVGASGSGKSTFIKLLLGFYNPTEGNIYLNDNSINKYKISDWRNLCGAVLQDGYIFTDTIFNNIVLKSENINYDKYSEAIEIANIKEFIENLPLKENSIIGSGGMGISQGQKQRILIARAIYKDPILLLFDEATNSLDANNELQIVRKLEKFFNNRTVITVAHRLSTVKNADQIIVLDKGKIVETGNHKELVKNKKIYYNLIKNQLELGN